MVKPCRAPMTRQRSRDPCADRRRSPIQFSRACSRRHAGQGRIRRMARFFSSLDCGRSAWSRSRRNRGVSTYWRRRQPAEAGRHSDACDHAGHSGDGRPRCYCRGRKGAGRRRPLPRRARARIARAPMARATGARVPSAPLLRPATCLLCASRGVLLPVRSAARLLRQPTHLLVRAPQRAATPAARDRGRVHGLGWCGARANSSPRTPLSKPGQISGSESVHDSARRCFRCPDCGRVSASRLRRTPGCATAAPLMPMPPICTFF